jgi:hypothetical protein
MAPRLQGELSPDGNLRLSIWGAGEAGRLKIAGLNGPFVIAPNRLQASDGGGVWVAQSGPALARRRRAWRSMSPRSSARPTTTWRGAT